LAFWAFFAKRPALYKTLTPWLMSLMHLLGRDKGYLRALPLASGWTDSRDFPTPQGGTFQSLYRKQKSNGRAA
jgi:L-lactate dehydrogenase complex protein LldF